MILRVEAHSKFKRTAIWGVYFLFCLAVSVIVITGVRADDWTPPPPSGEDGFDWIELKSGEWLKGHIKFMQQGELEFDSEKLDVKIWEMKDLRTIRSPRLLTMRLRDNQVIVGSLLVTINEIQVVNSSGTHTYLRSDLLSITPAGSYISAGWALDVSVGITSREGNTNEISNNTRIKLKHYTPKSRQSLEFLGNYGEIDSTVNKDDQRWTFNSDFFLTQRFFIRAPDLEYFHDSQQNLTYRITLGGSVGYDLIKTQYTEWQLTLGPAFQQNSYNTTESGKDDIEKTLTWVLGNQLEIKLTKLLDFTLDYRGQFTSQDVGNNIHHTMATLEFEIHKRLVIDLSFVWDRISQPEPDENGVTSKPDDYQFITSLGINL